MGTHRIVLVRRENLRRDENPFVAFIRKSIARFEEVRIEFVQSRILLSLRKLIVTQIWHRS